MSRSGRLLAPGGGAARYRLRAQGQARLWRKRTWTSSSPTEAGPGAQASASLCRGPGHRERSKPARAGRGSLTGAGALLQRLGHERVGDVLQPRTVLQPHGLQPATEAGEGGPVPSTDSPATGLAAILEAPGSHGPGAARPAEREDAGATGRYSRSPALGPRTRAGALRAGGGCWRERAAVALGTCRLKSASAPPSRSSLTGTRTALSGPSGKNASSRTDPCASLKAWPRRRSFCGVAFLGPELHERHHGRG